MAQTFDSVGQALFPTEWTGAEISTACSTFTAEDAEALAARQEAMASDRVATIRVEKGAAVRCDIDRPEEVTTLADELGATVGTVLLGQEALVQAQRVAPTTIGGLGPDSEPALLVAMDAAGIHSTEAVAEMDDETFEAFLCGLEHSARNFQAGVVAETRAERLHSSAGHEALRRLRNGRVLSEFAMNLLDELHTERRSVARHDEVVRWISTRAWSGGDTLPALPTYVFDPETGRVDVIPASYWAVDAFKPAWGDSRVTLEDTSLPKDRRHRTHAGEWPAKGIVGFRRADLEACLDEVSAQG